MLGLSCKQAGLALHVLSASMRRRVLQRQPREILEAFNILRMIERNYLVRAT